MHGESDDIRGPVDLDEVLADYMRRVDRGERVDQLAIIAAHPELAADLREYFSQAVAVGRFADGATADFAHQATPRGALEVRCPNCHQPTEVASDTTLTDVTCSACGSHFSLVDQSKATRMAPSLTKLGRFELIERLGVGGFGSVWKARDKELDRTVAIKIPRAGDMTADEQEKFFREARAAAQLRHPSIVSVHEVGRDGDNVYIVSDFVRGVTLGDWLTGQQLTSREAGELCAKIADALHHAHEQGVVHRDLKPANIMMDYDGQPHLMDFGLARRETGEVTMTMDGQVLGTPAYMSPEQAAGEAHTADRRSDVYSLGVILFQLLTDELPFRGNARMLIKQVISDEPPSPRKLNGNIPRDLETITLKCLEKKPESRYQSAKDISDELRRWINREPIHARPIGRIQRSWKWMKRKPALAALLATMCFVAVVAPATAIRQFSLAERAKDSAVKEKSAREGLQQQLYNAQLNMAYRAWHLGDYGRALQLLSNHMPKEGSRDIRRFDWHLLWDLCHPTLDTVDFASLAAKEGTLHSMLLLPEGTTLLIGTQRGVVIKWDANRRRVAGQFQAHQAPINDMAYHAATSRLATACDDGAVSIWNLDSNTRLLNVGSVGASSAPGRSATLLSGQRRSSIDFSPDGSRLLTTQNDGTVRLWATSDGTEASSIATNGRHTACTRFSPDGSQIAAAVDSKLLLIEVGTHRVVAEYEFDHPIFWVDFSPDGKYVAIATTLGDEFEWIEVATGERTRPSGTPHRNGLRDVQFAPDSKTIATTGNDRTIKLWHIMRRAELVTLRGQTDPVYWLAFLPSGNQLIALADQNRLYYWDLHDQLFRSSIGADTYSVRSMRFDRTGQQIVSCGDDGDVRLWDVLTHSQLAHYRPKSQEAVVNCLDWSGDTIAAGCRDGKIRFLDASTLAEKEVLDGNSSPVVRVQFSPSRCWLAAVNSDRRFVMWELKHGAPAEKVDFQSRTSFFAFAPSDEIAVGSNTVIERLQPQLPKPRPIDRLLGQVDNITALAYSPSGRYLAVACLGGEIRMWDLGPGREESPSQQETRAPPKTLFTLHGHEKTVRTMTFSSDGELLISGGDDRVIRIWDTAAGEQTGFIQTDSRMVTQLTLSPNDELLAAGGTGPGEIDFWGNHTIRPKVSVDENNNITDPPLSVLRSMIGKDAVVSYAVARTGRSPGWIYLNALPNYRHPDSFTVVLPGSSSYALRAGEIKSLDDLVGRRIRVRGRVERIGQMLRLVVTELEGGIALYQDASTLRTPQRGSAPALTDIDDLEAASDRTQEVAFVVRSTDRSSARKLFHINSEEDRSNERNLSIVVPFSSLGEFARLGIDNPDEEIVDQIVKVKGRVTSVRGQLEIRVDKPVDQMTFVDWKMVDVP